MSAFLKQFCCYCFLFFAAFVHAQQIQVISEYGNVLVGAKIVVNQLDGSLVSIETTDENGTLILPKSLEKCNLVVSYLGFITRTVSWDKPNNGTTIVTLKSKIEDLNPIELYGKQSIIKSGDTTLVELSDYKTEQDNRLSDVLKKIPGVNVSNDGSITFKGKPITDLLINGSKLFDRDYQKAVNNLNPEQMIRLKFIEKYSDNTGFKKGEAFNTALDINFEAPVVQSINATATKGQKDFTGLNLNYFVVYDSKASYLDLGFNNTGNSQARLFEKSSIQSNQNSIINHYGLPTISYLGNRLDDYLLTINNSFSINNNTRLSLGKENKHELLIKARKYWEETKQSNTSSSIIFDNETRFERVIVSDKSINSGRLEGNLQHNYTKGKHFSFNEIVFSDQRSDYKQSLLLNGVSQDFNRINTERFINLSSTYQFKRGDSLITEVKGLLKWVEQNLSSVAAISTNQNQENTTSSLHASSIFNHPIFIKNGNTLGVANIINLALNQAQNNLVYNQGQNNSLSQNLEQLLHSRLYMYGEHTRLKNNLQYSLGVDYFLIKDVLNSDYVLPYATISYNKLSLRETHTIQLSRTNDWLAASYRFSNTLRNEVDSFIIRSYQNEVVSRTNLSYNYNYSTLFTNLSLGLQYDLSNKVEINAFEIESNQTLNEATVLERSASSLTGNMHVTKFIKFLKGNIQYQVVYSRQNLFTSLSINDIESLTVQNIQQQLEFKKRFSKRFYASLYYKQTNQFVDLVQNAQQNKLSSAGMWLNYQLKNWNFISNGSLENLGNNRWYNLADIRVEYTPLRKPYYFEFTALNVLNENAIENQDIGVNYNITSRTNIAGARYLVSFNYTF